MPFVKYDHRLKHPWWHNIPENILMQVNPTPWVVKEMSQKNSFESGFHYKHIVAYPLGS